MKMYIYFVVVFFLGYLRSWRMGMNTYVIRDMVNTAVFGLKNSFIHVCMWYLIL